MDENATEFYSRLIIMELLLRNLYCAKFGKETDPLKELEEHRSDLIDAIKSVDEARADETDPSWVEGLSMRERMIEFADNFFDGVSKKLSSNSES